MRCHASGCVSDPPRERAWRFQGRHSHEGEYKADMKHGRGTYRYADGQVAVGRYEAGKNADGFQRSADGQTVWRFQDGQDTGTVSLEEARAIAARVSVSAPF